MREDDWEVVVEVMIRQDTGTRAGALRTIEFLTTLLRKNVLPASGRTYVADLLDKIVRNENPLPKKPSRSRGPSDFDIWAAFERDSRVMGKREGYEKVARKFGLAYGTAIKRCSNARRQLRSFMAMDVAAGVDRSEWMNALAKKYKLPVAVVERVMTSKR